MSVIKAAGRYHIYTDPSIEMTTRAATVPRVSVEMMIPLGYPFSAIKTRVIQVERRYLEHGLSPSSKCEANLKDVEIFHRPFVFISISSPFHSVRGRSNGYRIPTWVFCSCRSPSAILTATQMARDLRKREHIQSGVDVTAGAAKATAESTAKGGVEVAETVSHFQ